VRSPFSPLKHVVSHQLPNGLRVLLKEDHAWPLVSVHAWVRAGSIDETPREAGIAHVIEHMAFKGTSHYRVLDISRWVEMLGGAINAETSKEYTHYYIDVPVVGAAKAVDLLGELLHRATLEKAEWDRERPVVLEELKRRNDDPESLLWDLLNNAVFRDEHLQRAVIGSEETVSALNEDDLRRFYDRFYRAGGCQVIVVGDFQSSEMLAWIDKAFGSMPAGSPPRRQTVSENSYEPKHLQLKRPVEQTYLGFAIPTPSSLHPDQEALDLLAAVLGEGRSSRLVLTLRERRKLVWSVSTANYGHEGPGLFCVFAECDASKSASAKKAVRRLLEPAGRARFLPKEVTRAKRQIQQSWLQSFESYHQQASNIGLYSIDHQLPRLANYLERINSITTNKLQKTAEKYLNDLALSTAVITA
jgi:zinc protease